MQRSISWNLTEAGWTLLHDSIYPAPEPTPPAPVPSTPATTPAPAPAPVPAPGPLPVAAPPVAPGTQPPVRYFRRFHSVFRSHRLAAASSCCIHSPSRSRYGSSYCRSHATSQARSHGRSLSLSLLYHSPLLLPYARRSCPLRQPCRRPRLLRRPPNPAEGATLPLVAVLPNP